MEVRINLPVKHYTETDVALARQKGKVIGWLQAGAVMIAGSMILNVLGWIPTVLVVGAVGWGGYKWMTRSSQEDEEGEDEIG